MRTKAILLAAGLAALLAPTAAAADAPESAPGNPQQVLYNGRTIDLAISWEGAQACAELGDTTQCYDTEAELLAAHPELTRTSSTPDTARAACGSTLALYDLTSNLPPVIYLSTTGVVHNLSLFGFDDRTSSYTIGGCRASFFDGANTAGPIYPGATSAGSSAPSMSSGWNNRVSSIWIY